MVKKVNAIDTSKLVNKTEYNAKTKYAESKIPRITNSPTTGVENKISNVSNLVTKADYVKKTKGNKGKYLTTSDYDKFSNNVLDANIKIKNS